MSPEVGPELQDAPAQQYDHFFKLLTELADSVLSNTDPEIWFMGLYFGPPSNPNDVFMLWVTQQSSNGRFNAEPILDAIKTPIQTIPLMTISRSFSMWSMSKPASAFDRSFGKPPRRRCDRPAHRGHTGRAAIHIMLPKDPSNPKVRGRECRGAADREVGRRGRGIQEGPWDTDKGCGPCSFVMPLEKGKFS